MDNACYGEINYKEKSSCSKDFCRIVFEDNTDDENIAHHDQQRNIIYGNICKD